MAFKFEKFLPYCLVIFVGYCLADLVVISVRDKMLPSKAPTKSQHTQKEAPIPNRGFYSTITSRNMFSFDGSIPEALSEKGNTKKNAPDADPVPSTLPLNLVGTIVHSAGEKSIANIEVKSKNQTMAYGVGRDIEGIATVVKVERAKVIIRNTNNLRLEYIEMKLTDKKVSFAGAKPEPVKATDVVQAAEGKFEIKRSDLTKYTSDLSSILQQAAMAPKRNANGEVECFQFLSIQPGSIYTQLGFQKGDCLSEVNGEKIDSPAKGMELFRALQSSSSINIQMNRDGQKINHDYNIK